MQEDLKNKMRVCTCRSRLGRGDRNITDFSKVPWKRAAETYSAVLSQTLAKVTSVEE